MTAADLDKALREAGIPIIGVSIGHEQDKTSWRIDFAPTATPSERTLAQQVIDGFDGVALPAPLNLTAKDVLGWAAKKLGVTVDAAIAEIQAEKAK